MSCKRCLICADFSPDSDQNTLSLQEELLWIRILVKNVLLLGLFHLLSSPDVNWWTGVLWCFYQTHSDGTHSLQSIHWLSFWRHPFTAEHPLTLILTAPIHCRASITETHFSKPDLNHLHLEYWGNSHLQVNCSFNAVSRLIYRSKVTRALKMLLQ